MRLIDADELVEKFNTDECALDPIEVRLRILHEPTAYDIDKVVEQLEKAKDEIANEDYCRGINDKGKCYGKNCFKCCTEYLIEIVKAGGIDE